MFGSKKFKVPGAFKDRLDAAASKHGYDSGQAFAEHLVDARMDQYEVPGEIKKFKKQLDWVVEEHGYSDQVELLEHLLERGLRAYEEPAADAAALENRLRGLGYIE